MNDQLRRRSVGPPAARSMLLTILGEYVLPAKDGVWQETLISALGGLDYKTQAARQALARSVSGGWLRTERHGRRARMYLTGDTREMLTSGAARIYGFGAPREWDGRWLLVVVRVPEERRDVRHLIRSQLAWAGFGSLGNGLWITPHVDREAEVTRVVRDLHVAELVSFRAQTELVHTWRKFPFLDPDLPQAMLPAHWPRTRAHLLFEERHAEWQAAAQEYFTSLERLLPAPQAA